jgi:protein TonB
MSRQQNVWMTEPDEAKLSLVSSFVLHAIAAGALATYFLLFTELSGNTWGGAEKSQGAIQATLVSSAPTIPLPHPQQPTENVLATETPSPAPAPPTPAAKAVPEEKAIPIPEKIAKPKPVPEAKTTAPPIPHPMPMPRTPTTSTARQPTEAAPDRANFGEAQATRIPMTMVTTATGTGAINVQSGDFGSRYAWYVAAMGRKIQQNWYGVGRVGGPRVYVTFDIARDGTPGNVRIEKTSGDSSLDTSALRAMQRIDTFGPLPNDYRGNSVSVEFYFDPTH